MRSEVEQVRADGNRTSVTTPGGTESYRYDQLDQVTGVTYTDGTTANYGYDGDNLRVHATGTTAATGNLLYDRETDAAAPQLIADANGAYTWTPAGQLSQQTATATSYTLADALGSTRALTDSSGTVTATVDYDVYGNVRNQTGTWGPQGYTAGIQTGSLVTLGERDLRTDIGQFLSTDPEQPGGNGITGWNQYTYVANNPTTYVDPTDSPRRVRRVDSLRGSVHGTSECVSDGAA
ncbi:MAG TPA: RHS repeat-associated core domain-containing protein [Propionicimonas sp.]|jgi:RHS repeat-associated protein